MSVPVDDSDSYNDLQIDFSRKNHTFNLDNVGYISKENGKRYVYFVCITSENRFGKIKQTFIYIITLT